MKWLNSFFSWLFSWRGANTRLTPSGVITKQMNELRPLPMGQKEFDEWAARIISGAMIPTEKPECLPPILATMLMQLGPTVTHKEDAYFVYSLRKAAINEVANSNFQAFKLKQQQEATKSLELVQPVQ